MTFVAIVYGPAASGKSVFIHKSVDIHDAIYLTERYLTSRIPAFPRYVSMDQITWANHSERLASILKTSEEEESTYNKGFMILVHIQPPKDFTVNLPCVKYVIKMTDNYVPCFEKGTPAQWREEFSVDCSNDDNNTID